MRGKASKRIDGAVTLRITPAYAGKRLFDLWAWHRLQDHPRLCGEKVVNKGVILDYTRITPAYAGKRH